MSEGKVTISSIAQLLNVSAITVSRALSGQPGVGKELRKKIIVKAKELGYKKIKTIDKIKVLLLIRHRFVKDNSNFSYMVQGIEKYIKHYGAEFTMEFVEREKQEKLLLPYNLSKKHRFNSVILLGCFSEDYARLIRERIENMVVVNNYYYEVDCDYVYSNHNRTGYKAVKYLVDKGHTKIGFIGTEGNFNNPQCYLGFCRALEKHRLELFPQYIIATKEEMEVRVKDCIASNNLPSVFICESDNTALKLIKLLYELGISVPNDLSVIGIGNTEMSSLSIPALTTFDLNIEYFTEVAVRLGLNRMNDWDRPYRSTYIDTFLVERNSVIDLSE